MATLVGQNQSTNGSQAAGAPAVRTLSVSRPAGTTAGDLLIMPMRGKHYLPSTPAAVSIDSVAPGAGSATVTCNAPHLFAVGDRIYGSAFTNAAWNTRFKVTSIVSPLIFTMATTGTLPATGVTLATTMRRERWFAEPSAAGWTRHVLATSPEEPNLPGSVIANLAGTDNDERIVQTIWSRTVEEGDPTSIAVEYGASPDANYKDPWLTAPVLVWRDAPTGVAGLATVRAHRSGTELVTLVAPDPAPTDPATIIVCGLGFTFTAAQLSATGFTRLSFESGAHTFDIVAKDVAGGTPTPMPQNTGTRGRIIHSFSVGLLAAPPTGLGFGLRFGGRSRSL